MTFIKQIKVFGTEQKVNDFLQIAKYDSVIRNTKVTLSDIKGDGRILVEFEVLSEMPVCGYGTKKGKYELSDYRPIFEEQACWLQLQAVIKNEEVPTVDYLSSSRQEFLKRK